MNKLFNKGRKHRILSLFVVFAMVLTLLPANIVKAETKTYTINEIKAESDYGFTINTEGKAVYDETEGAKAGNYGKLRVRAYVPDDYVFTAGDVITMSYETNIDGIKVYGGYDNNNTFSMGSISSSGSALTYTVTDADAAIFAGNTSNDAEFFRFKADAGADATDAYLSVTSVIITQEVTGGDNNGNAGGNAGGTEGGNDPNGGNAPDPTVVPTATVNAASTGYTVVNNEDGSVTVTYDAATVGWNTLKISVNNCNKAVYSKVKFEITPESDMVLCITDAAGSYPYYRDHTTLSAAEGKATLIYDLVNDETGFQFYCDANGGTGQKTFTIHSIEFINPNAPTAPGTPGGDPNPDDNPAGGNGPDPTVVPTATVNAASTGYTVVNNDDGSVTVTYDAATVGWNTLKISVNNCNKAVYSKVKFEITPESDMVLCITDAAGSYPYYRDHTTLSAADGKATLIYDLVNDETGFQFYCDSNGGTGQKTFKIHSIEFINPNAPVEPEEPAVVEIPATLKVESGDYTIDGQGRLYSATGAKLRGMIEFPVAFKEVEVGGVLTINYETTYASKKLKAEFAHTNGGKINGVEGDSTLIHYLDSSNNALSIPITEEYVHYFAASPTEYTKDTSTRVRLKADALNPSAESWFKLISVTYTAPGSDDEDDEGGEQPGATDGKPVVTFDTATSDDYKVTTNDKGELVVTYPNNISWEPFRFKVENSDISKYYELQIDFTPSWDGMHFGVYYGSDVAIQTIENGAVESAERHTRKLTLSTDLTEFYFYIDTGAGDAPLPTQKEVTFTIHSIKIVDPNALPESKAQFTSFEGTQAEPDNDKNRTGITFTKNEAGGVADFTFNTNYTLRLYANYTGYTYTPGDMLVVYSDDLADFSGGVQFCYPTDQTVAVITAIEGDGYVAYELPNVTVTTQPTQIRWKGTLKGTDASIKGMYIWDKATYDEVFATKYDPDQLPQGIAVTYYDDIYSRGFTWNTNDEVPRDGSALYYIKQEGTMTADSITWKEEGVKRVNPTMKPYEAVTSESSKVWHTFKAVIGANDDDVDDELEYGATYFYRIGSEEYGWSKVGSFTVEEYDDPEDSEDNIDSLHFIHVTDTQEENQADFKKYAKLVADAYSKMPNAAFMAHTGDQVNRGEKNNEMHMEEWMYVLGEPKEQLMNSVLMPAVGNHDCADYVFTDRFNINWADYKEDTDEDLKTGGVYYYTYGEAEDGVLLISLNTADLWGDFTPQQTWLENVLESHKDYKWKIVQMHAGAMTGGGHTNDGESKYLRKNIMPMFAKYKVDLVLQGHDHVYTRTRSMAYGVNPFEEGNQYFDGHTPIYLSAKEETRTVNGEERTVYIEPQGTHYITINASGGKRYPEFDNSKLDEVIVEGEGVNPINPTDEETGKGGSMCMVDLPMYGLISIEGDLLVYDAYTYSSSGSELYDTFAVDKSSDRGYTYDTIDDGKKEVFLYGIEVLDKKSDGHPAKLDLTGFNCSNPAIMDTAALKYEITGTLTDGTTYDYKRSNLKYGMMPDKPGDYTITISVPKSNKDFYGEVSIDFSITP